MLRDASRRDLPHVGGGKPQVDSPGTLPRRSHMEDQPSETATLLSENAVGIFGRRDCAKPEQHGRDVRRPYREVVLGNGGEKSERDDATEQGGCI